MDTPQLKWTKLRILCVMACLGFFAFLILFRSYDLHILDNQRLGQLAKNQYEAHLPLRPKRGMIFDRHGEILAMDIRVISVALHPHLVVDPEALSAHLADRLNLSPKEILKKIQADKKFVWIKRRVAATKTATIDADAHPGLVLIPEYRRFYPNRTAAGHVLGAVGFDADALGGLELSMNHYLKSADDQIYAQKDAKGRLYTPVDEQVPAHDITLTLDLSLQHIAEKHLSEGAAKYGATRGFALIMNPANGEILAMANTPSFNPNSYWKFPQSQWTNLALAKSFEPGSTFKTILLASALERGGVTPKDTFDCEKGTYRIRNTFIHDHGPNGILSVSDIIRVSSNIGAAKIARKIGVKKFHQTITEFGFGEKTNIHLPAEESGRLLPAKQWTAIDLANIAFGQGISVTGLQMAKAYGIIANGGYDINPRIVSSIILPDGKPFYQAGAGNQVPVISPETSSQIRAILTDVVSPQGTAPLARLTGFSVAGKTGTAQKFNNKTGGYDKENFVSSFVGMVPADKPEFLIYIVYDSPRPVYYGGRVAAPVFKNMAEGVLAHVGLRPEPQRLAKNDTLFERPW